jgi:predicted ATP-dependent endonuclease of OLD family
MFISNLIVKNYKLFNDEFKIINFNVPDNINDGTGLTTIVGENGCGKTTILDAIACSLLEYKAEGFDISDMNDSNKETEITIETKDTFNVKSVFPNSSFDAKGFKFIGKTREKSNQNKLLSLIMTDQLYISTDDEKPKPGSPDLRMKVTNSFGTKRFNELDVLYLDKNRLYQTRAGTYNDTRFDRIMDDFNFQYYKNQDNVENLNKMLNEKIKKELSNKNLENAINKFKEISGHSLKLDFIDNYLPFKKANLVVETPSNMQIDLASLGSGYEMMFSLIYSFYMSKQSGKKLIILIDEPELHLHPRLQEKFVDFILEISKESQVILTTHSPLLIKQLSYNENVKNIVLKKEKEVKEFDERKLSYVSSNETNYLAFDLPSEEYHNELYESLMEKYSTSNVIKRFDNEFFIQQKKEDKIYPWEKQPNQVSIHTFIRNQIHHRKDNRGC